MSHAIGIAVAAPHATTSNSAGRVMATVMAALAPATLFGFWLYGWRQVPTHAPVLGQRAAATRPEIEQIMLSAPDGLDGEELERACSALDSLVRAETYLDANVNVSLIFQQLAAALARNAAA